MEGRLKERNGNPGLLDLSSELPHHGDMEITKAGAKVGHLESFGCSLLWDRSHCQRRACWVGIASTI